jgi:hypothetical protein
MTEDLQRFGVEFERAMSEASKLCYMTREKELQEEACVFLNDLRGQARHIKAGAIRAEDEDSANRALALEKMLSSIISELTMWVALKQDRTGAAWNSLVDSQMAAHDALLAHHVASQFENCSARLATLESILFPPLTFMSTAMTAKVCECSICGSNYL